jgi:hypothetical protein
MCGANKRFFFYLFLALLFASVAGALRGEEGEPAAYMPMYLISETELRSIGEYRKKSESEKQNWLLQVSELRTRAGRLNERAAVSQKDSENLNRLLLREREKNLKLTQSFNGYEAARLTMISLKNGEIAGLKLEAERYKGKARSRLVVIAAPGAAWVIFIAFKARRFFRPFNILQ